MTSTERKIKSMGAVAASTAAGGALGLCSNALIASQFGRGLVTDAFFMAQSFLRVGKFFQIGPLQQIVMPIFLDAHTKGDIQRARRYASSLITLTLLVSCAVAVVLWAAAPWIVGLIAPGFDGEQRALTISLTRIFVPVIVVAVLINLLATFLRAFHRFGLVEWLARLPGVALVIILLWGAGRWQIKSLVWALAAGSLIQLGLLWLSVSRAGVSYRPTLDRHQWRQAELRTTWTRLWPFFISSLFSQGQFFVHRMVTSTQAVGTLSAFSYADRLVEFLIGMFGILPLVLFPQFIQEALTLDRDDFRRRLARVVLLVSLVVLPVTVLLVVFSHPLIAVLFQRGQFDAQASRDTALALGWLAMGLFAWNLWGLSKAAAYAVQRPSIINRTVIGAAIGTSVLTLTLGRWGGLAGLSICWAAVPYVAAALQVWQLRRDIPAVHRIVWNPQLVRVMAAAAGMGLGCWGLRETVWAHWFASSGWLSRFLGLGLVSLGGLAGYWMLLVGLGVQVRHDLRSLTGRAIGLSRRAGAAPMTSSPQQVIPVGAP